MLINGNKLNCDLGDEMISYLYGESSEPERSRFETHLVGCVACTDEFASIANARFSVFEWHKEEFAPLATPEIVIPYQTRDKAAKAKIPGFLAGFRGLVMVPRFAFAVGAIIAVLGLGFVGADYLREKEIADVTVEEKNSSPAALPEASGINATTVVKTVVPTLRQISEPTPKKQNDPELVRTTKRSKIPRSLMAATKRPVQRETGTELTQERKAPVLNNFQDNDDRSLRLADLFADGGSKR